MPDRRVIGVDMGGTKLLAGVIDSDPRAGLDHLALSVHHRHQVQIRGLGRRDLLDTVEKAVQRLLGQSDAEVDAVGFGIPAVIDRRSGVSGFSTHLELAGDPFAEIMSARLGLPCFIDNDGNMAALAEHRAGAALGARDAVTVTIGTGVAGGLILDGRLYRGATGSGAEIGHMVIDADGPRCQGNCPNHGCFEVMASGSALIREAQRIGLERPDSGLGQAVAAGREPLGPIITELALATDPGALEALGLIGTRLGVACANIVNIFNPEVIVVGGGVIAAGELLLGPAREEMRRRALPPSRDVVQIVAARFGVAAGMLGAGIYALDELTASPGRP